MNDELPAMALWEKVVGEIFDRTARFPKAARYPLGVRIESACLDVLDSIVLARFATRTGKMEHLKKADIDLTRLMVFIRLAHSRGFIGKPGYEHLSRRIVDVGAMLGGWRKSLVPGSVPHETAG